MQIIVKKYTFFSEHLVSLSRIILASLWKGELLGPACPPAIHQKDAIATKDVSEISQVCE